MRSKTWHHGDYSLPSLNHLGFFFSPLDNSLDAPDGWAAGELWLEGRSGSGGIGKSIACARTCGRRGAVIFASKDTIIQLCICPESNMGNVRLRLSSSKRSRSTDAGASRSSERDNPFTVGSETFKSRLGGDWSVGWGIRYSWDRRWAKTYIIWTWLASRHPAAGPAQMHIQI